MLIIEDEREKSNKSQMASTSNSSPLESITCLSFNQDKSGFAIGTKDGFKVYDSTGGLCFQRSVGAFSIVEMLFSTSLLTIVGAGEQPSLSPRCLHMYNTHTNKTLRELNFMTAILAVRVNKKRLIVVLQDKTYIYDINSVTILDTIDTIPNAKGLCAFSPNSDSCYLALPASKTKGWVLIYNTLELNSLCQIDAHRNPLAALEFSSNGMYIATASEQGTVIRVHLVAQATKSFSFRRGTYPSKIHSLSFGSSSKELPEILVATSSSGSIHVFLLESTINPKKSGGFLGSIIPGPINNALENAHHHILHQALSPGIKSYSMVHNVVKTIGPAVFRAILVIIDENGNLREYSFTLNKMNDPQWKLKRVVNLLVSGDSACSSTGDDNLESGYLIISSPKFSVHEQTQITIEEVACGLV